jgi:hypothetical protein
MIAAGQAGVPMVTVGRVGDGDEAPSRIGTSFRMSAPLAERHGRRLGR